jgi:hypothetical protein
MLVPIAFLLLVLIAALIGGFYVAKRRVVDDARPSSDLRPDDRLPTARPDLSNPPIHQPEVTGHRVRTDLPTHRPV